jgi:hypothetical protein
MTRIAVLRKPKRPCTLDIGTAISLLIFYFLVRFFLGSLIAMPFLVIFTSLFIRALRPSVIRRSGAVFFVPALVLALLAIPGSVLAGDVSAATYFGFLSLTLWCKAIGPAYVVCKSLKRLRRIVWTYLIITVPFLLSSTLQSMSTRVLSPQERIANLYVSEETHGLMAFFYHSGEFGVFSASLGAVLLTASMMAEGKYKVLSLDSVLFLVLSLYVLISRSTTGLVIVVYSAFATIFPGRVAGWATVWVFIVQFITQFFLAADMATVIGRGSLAWRYQMAAAITNAAPIVDFAPERITRLQNWPHSILMDYSLCFGLAGGMLFVLMQLWYSVSSANRYVRGWNALFLAAACINPMGAGPLGAMIATAFSFCKQPARQVRSKELTRFSSKGNP